MIETIDDIWSSDLLHLIEYGPSNYTGYRYILVVIDVRFKYVRWTPMKIKYAQTKNDELSNFKRLSKKQTQHFETDDGNEFVNRINNEFSN